MHEGHSGRNKTIISLEGILYGSNDKHDVARVVALLTLQLFLTKKFDSRIVPRKKWILCSNSLWFIIHRLMVRLI